MFPIQKILSYLALFLLIATNATAQSGTLRGTLTDKNSGEAMMFGNLLLLGTDFGATTDFDGKYSIEKIPIGTYEIEFSSVGYPNAKITDVIIKEDDVTLIDYQMDNTGGVELEEIVVKATALQPRSEVALLTLRRKAFDIQNSVSSENIAKYAASNAADAVLRTTGTSVVDGKYVIVRGLGDRYTNAQLNGLPLPSTDPYRNSVQLDLIPANLLDNVILSKTFTPDKPADFAGASVNINTKTYPSAFTLQAGVSVTYNTQSSFDENFLTYEGGDTDWLGYDDGSRALDPLLTERATLDLLRSSSYLQARKIDSVEYRALLSRSAKAFTPILEGYEEQNTLDHSISLSVGNQFQLFGNPLGISVGGSYRRSFDSYSNAPNNYYEIRGDNLAPFYELSDNVSVDNPIVSGLATLGYKLGKQSEISFNALYNHDGEKMTRFLEGEVTEFDGFFRSRVLQWRERTLQGYQGNFQHVFGETGIKLELGGQIVSMEQDEPDLRFAPDKLNPDPQFEPAEFELPSHIWRNLKDEQRDLKADLSFPDLIGKEDGDGFKWSLLKVGGLISRKERDFSEFSYLLEDGSNTAPEYDSTLTINEYVSPENLGDLGPDPDRPDRHLIGLYWVDQESASKQNTYMGEKNITSGYVMSVFEFNKFKLIGGVRAERTELGAVSATQLEQAEFENPDTMLSNNIDTLQYFPAINLVYALNDKMNLRASYTQTLARGNMREIAPFAAEDYAGGFVLSGNPDLQLTNITNYDLRWEWFPTPGELVSASIFYKEFINPIGTAFVITANNPEIRYENLGYEAVFNDSLGRTEVTNGEATVLGLELEFRKKLGFISPKLDNFAFSSNITLQQSEQQVAVGEVETIEQRNPAKGTTRPFFGQSDFLLNAALNYSNDDLGLDALISANYFSERLVQTSRGADPDVYEQPRLTLDFSISKALTERFSVRFVARNLLNQDVRQTVDFNNETFDITRFKRGTEFRFSVNYRI